MLCLLTFEISEDRDGKNSYTRGPWYTCHVYRMAEGNRAPCFSYFGGIFAVFAHISASGH